MISADVAKFNDELESFISATEKALVKTVRESVIEVGATVIRLSPVLTGRFRGNWQMTVDVPSNQSLATTDPEGQETLAAIRAMAATLDPGEVAYIVNNLTYGINVETEGWAVTLPYMPVRLTMVEFKGIVERAAAANKVSQ